MVVEVEGKVVGLDLEYPGFSIELFLDNRLTASVAPSKVALELPVFASEDKPYELREREGFGEVRWTPTTGPRSLRSAILSSYSCSNSSSSAVISCEEEEGLERSPFLCRPMSKKRNKFNQGSKIRTRRRRKIAHLPNLASSCGASTLHHRVLVPYVVYESRWRADYLKLLSSKSPCGREGRTEVASKLT